MENKIFNTKFLVLIMFMFGMSFTTNTIHLEAETNNNEKIYSSATMSDDFSNNEVLVILNKEKSKETDLQNLYHHFDNIEFSNIQDLTSSYDSAKK